jgi:hypothetical protein
MGVIRDYELNYIVNAGAAVGGLKRIKAELIDIDRETKQVASSLGPMNAGLAAAGIHSRNIATDLSALTSGLNVTTSGAQGLGSAMGGLAPSFLMFQLGSKMVQEFGGYINAARDNLDKLGEQAGITREKLRELAGIRGQTGVSDALVAENVAAGAAAGMMPEQAKEFQTIFEGATDLSIEKNKADPTKGMSKETSIALGKEAMKFATRVDIKPQTAANLAGVLGQYGHVESAEQGMDQIGRVHAALNKGRGHMEPLVNSLIKAMGVTVGEEGAPVETPAEMAVYLATQSANVLPGEAGTLGVDSVLALRRFGDGAQGKALDRLKITPNMSHEKAMSVLIPHLQKADKDGTGADAWLKKNGFRRKEEVRALVNESRNWNVIQAGLKTARDPADKGAEEIRKNEEFLRADKVGIRKKSEANDAAQEWIVGKKEEMRVVARHIGGQVARQQGLKGGLANAARHAIQDGMGMMTLIGKAKGERTEEEMLFMDNLFEEAKKVGIDLGAEFEKGRPTKIDEFGRKVYTDGMSGFGKRDQPLFPTGESERTRRARIQGMFDAEGGDFPIRMAQKITAAGGAPWAGAQEETQRKLRQIQRDGDTMLSPAEKQEKERKAAKEAAAKVPILRAPAAGAPGAAAAAVPAPGAHAMTDGLKELRELVHETKRTNTLIVAANSRPPEPGWSSGFLPGRA